MATRDSNTDLLQEQPLTLPNLTLPNLTLPNLTLPNLTLPNLTKTNLCYKHGLTVAPVVEPADPSTKGSGDNEALSE